MSSESAKQRLDKVLSSLGVDPKKSLGQNFLISDNVIGKILKATENFQFKNLLEIGPGAGALTSLLINKDANFKVIELDRVFSQYWRDQGLEVIEADALHVDWDKWNLPETLLVSNLPYQISSSLVIDRSLDEAPLTGMVLMFQKEVAQRIRAEIRTEHYGMLSVIAQNFWEVAMVSEAGPGDFWPPPRVASRVLSFKPKSVTGFDRNKFLKFVKQGFSQRRKLLRSNLSGILSAEKRLQLDEWLLGQVQNPQARAEELSPDMWRRLFLEMS
ncbi:MAG: 16S rRNA (adenine(1518)-N(6)/adenine(1519)-N(6))-dimethyltransferase RsmA [Bdellovibrionota bacterium]